MAQRPYHHGDLRHALLERAIVIINEEGVERVSLRRLARELGVSHAAPSRHFASKAALLSAVARFSYEALTSSTLETLATRSGEAAAKRLTFIIDHTIAWAQKNPALFTVMINPDVSRFADEDLKAALTRYIALIATAVREAQANGLYHERDTRAVVAYGVAATLGASLLLSDPLFGDIVASVGKDAIGREIREQIVGNPGEKNSRAV